MITTNTNLDIVLSEEDVYEALEIAALKKIRRMRVTPINGVDMSCIILDQANETIEICGAVVSVEIPQIPQVQSK